MTDDLLLSLLWFLPLAGAFLVLVVPSARVEAIKAFSLVVSVLTLALSVYALSVYAGSKDASAPLAERAARNPLFSPDTVPAHDLVVRNMWVPYVNVQYYLGLDGISLSLILLTGVVGVLSCLASWGIERQVKGYFALFLVLLASLNGVFLALDLVLFYVFFEVMLLPMYFLIAVWGGERKEYAAIKFLLYTLFGSVFILVAILLLYFWSSVPVEVEGTTFFAHTFDALRLAQAAGTSYYGQSVQNWIFGLFLVGFLVKLPSFPFHTWLPDAHVEAPTPISMMLAGVLLKVGGYGLIRLAWPLAPAGAQELSMFVAGLGVFSILYGALAAMAQTDFKALVAYSSISHMGYVTLGLAVMTGLASDPRFYAYGVLGALYMMIAHGVTSTGMFFLVGVVYDRLHTRNLKALGGLSEPMPVYYGLGLVIFFGAMGLPGLCGFWPEVWVVLSAFPFSRTLAVLAALAVVLTAGYILWTIQRVWLGRNHAMQGLPDLSIREKAIAGTLAALTILLGLFPQAVVRLVGPSVEQVVKQVASSPVRQEAETGSPKPARLAQAQDRENSP